MARISVGPMDEADRPISRRKVIEAFKSLASPPSPRLDGYSGERSRSPRVADQHTTSSHKMLRPNDDAIDLNYRLRKTATTKIIDVYLSGHRSASCQLRSNSPRRSAPRRDGW